jgi:membrane protein
LRRALDAMWGVEPAPAEMRVDSLARVAFGQVLMVLLVVGVALAVVALVVLSTGWTYLTGRIEESFSGSAALFRAGDVLVSFGITALIIALLYQVVPMAKMHRADRWIGALLSAVLFTIGKEAFGIYISHSSTASAYGAAGSLIVFLVWVYYSAWIIFYGAEVAKVYGRRHGREVTPRKGAQRVATR